MVQWRFPSNDFGENKGINDSGVAMFRGTPLKSLAREICQNSLDAATGKKVRIDFNMFYIPTEDIPGKRTLQEAFKRCLSFWQGQKAEATREFFSHAIDIISKDKCCFLRISDFYTTGLRGSHEEINTDWTNLTKSSGASDKKGTAGGSFGIGKYAPFACSDFSTVYYSTYDIDGVMASQGVTRLVTFKREEDDLNTQGTGYYGNEKNTPVYEQMCLDPEFSRSDYEYGTDIYIAGYKYGSSEWKTDIITSILDGFLGALWYDRLEVFVGDTVLNKKTLGKIIENYRNDLISYTEKYYEVLISETTKWFSNNFMGWGKLELGLLLGSQDSPNRVSMIRQTGMKIMDKDRLPGHVPFTGVLFINGEQINEKLRLIENPEHTKWEPERSKNPIQARQLLKSLNDYIKEKIEEVISTGASESVDAAGVGAFIPDEENENNTSDKEETVNEKIKEIEIKEIKRKSLPTVTRGANEASGEEKKEGRTEKGGNEENWFHDNGKTHKPGVTSPEEAHTENTGRNMPVSKDVGVEKFICVPVDKSKGKYIVNVIPDMDCINGEMELYLSAETQRYEAPIVKANVIGKESSFHQNIIDNLTFVKGEPLKISLELDYSDYCSMEVILRATSK